MTNKKLKIIANRVYYIILIVAGIIGLTIDSKSETMSVTVTAYSLHSGQTDSTPLVGAWNNKLSNKDKMKSIAISQDMFGVKGLWNNKKVFVICNGKGRMYTIRDTMNKRWKKRLDICMGTDRKAAMRWGKRKCIMHYNMKRKKNETTSKKNVDASIRKSRKRKILENTKL